MVRYLPHIDMKLSKRIIFIAGVVILLIGGFMLFEVSKSRTFQFFGEIIPRVETDEKVVALTFDDAPSKHTSEVLEILTENDVPATFYVIGSALEKDMRIGKTIVLQGHELGNHSYSHERFYLKSQSYIHEEIDKTNNLIRKAGYAKEITFRPPNGKKLLGLPWYLQQNNIKTIMWDVEPDTVAQDMPEGNDKTSFIIAHTIEHTRPGSIILLHPFCDSCQSDRDAITGIIEGLRANGYTFVTVSDLLSRSN